MYGGKTESVKLWRTLFKDSFEKTFLRLIFTEFERRVDVQNHEFGWIRFQNRIFFKLLNNDDEK